MPERNKESSLPFSPVLHLEKHHHWIVVGLDGAEIAAYIILVLAEVWIVEQLVAVTQKHECVAHGC